MEDCVLLDEHVTVTVHTGHLPYWYPCINYSSRLHKHTVR